jgi:hypothetical protein
LMPFIKNDDTSLCYPHRKLTQHIEKLFRRHDEARKSLIVREPGEREPGERNHSENGFAGRREERRYFLARVSVTAGCRIWIPALFTVVRLQVELLAALARHGLAPLSGIQMNCEL